MSESALAQVLLHKLVIELHRAVSYLSYLVLVLDFDGRPSIVKAFRCKLQDVSRYGRLSS